MGLERIGDAVTAAVGADGEQSSKNSETGISGKPQSTDQYILQIHSTPLGPIIKNAAKTYTPPESDTTRCENSSPAQTPEEARAQSRAEDLSMLALYSNTDALRIWAIKSYASLAKYIDSNEAHRAIVIFGALMRDANEGIRDSAFDIYPLVASKLDPDGVREETRALLAMMTPRNDRDMRLWAFNAFTLLFKNTDPGTYNLAEVVSVLREFFTEEDEQIRGAAIDLYKLAAPRLDRASAREEAVALRSIFLNNRSWPVCQAAFECYIALTLSTFGPSEAMEEANILREVLPVGIFSELNLGGGGGSLLGDTSMTTRRRPFIALPRTPTYVWNRFIVPTTYHTRIGTFTSRTAT